MAFLDVLKLIFLPALIAGAIYLALAYVVMPLYRNHYLRYSQYIPLDGISTSISARTSGLRTRILDTLGRYLLPAHMRWQRERQSMGTGEDVYFGEEEGENMVGFDVTPSRRDRLARGGSWVMTRGGGAIDGPREEIPSERRLSRDLEEGFRDSSEADEDEGDDRRR